MSRKWNGTEQENEAERRQRKFECFKTLIALFLLSKYKASERVKCSLVAKQAANVQISSTKAKADNELQSTVCFQADCFDY